jgi:hypothetical protein
MPPDGLKESAWIVQVLNQLTRVDEIEFFVEVKILCIPLDYIKAHLPDFLNTHLVQIKSKN